MLVSSRDPDGHTGTVRMWFALVPPGVVHLLTMRHTRKAERWQRDPWVRLRVPETDQLVEGTVRVLSWAEVEPVAERLVEAFDMAGATTPEALQRLLEEHTHIVLRVELAA